MSDEKPKKGVTRKVTFEAYCHECPMGWRGEKRDRKGDAAFDLACHNVDKHGGSFRGDA